MGLYEKAADNYALAQIAFREKMYDAAASRLYYALCQACVKKHMESGRSATDFMSAHEKIVRETGLRSSTDAPKWPHDVLTRYASLNALGLSATQRQTVTHAKRWRVVGDYGDTETVDPERLGWLMERAMEVFRQLRAPIRNKEIQP